MSDKNLWWGYRHINGTIQVKRYFDERGFEEAKESDFVELIFPPFEARDRDEALQGIHNAFPDL